MPTTRPRYQITETDEVARALDAAERRWPGEPRSRLLVRLVIENGARVAELTEEEAARRAAAVDSLAGSFAGVYPEGYLEELRSDWPE
ncbi:hypothetical protein QT381_05540 [Galbitalea sp. SE-J8]|uniref:hypothetical protein n=1 Tax=Galbitalea sp. SE-J8 TaxID=3054952 RepID=UPI00259D187C|nr:hypothetical protein [Galbitalea sp. SE-J8]MDM4762465.1 hypothetical protein [Galbitalea sp. SE-J8]